MIWIIKCRDCLFKTTDIMEVYQHIIEEEHKDYALMDGNEVEIDWMHIEMKLIRGEPET